MPKRLGYYREYEAAHINSHRFLAKAAEEVVERLGQPYRQKKRGKTTEAGPRCSRRPSNNLGSPGLHLQGGRGPDLGDSGGEKRTT
jgi:hypothetical protein